jgi:hypothetical protein
MYALMIGHLLARHALGRPLVAINRQHVLHRFHSSIIERPAIGAHPDDVRSRLISTIRFSALSAADGLR